MFRYGVAIGACKHHPAVDLRDAPPPVPTRHLAAIVDPKKAVELLRAMGDYADNPVTRAALALSALTAATSRRRSLRRVVGGRRTTGSRIGFWLRCGARVGHGFAWGLGLGYLLNAPRYYSAPRYYYYDAPVRTAPVVQYYVDQYGREYYLDYDGYAVFTGRTIR